jgi:ATP-dependent Clp protease adapter protein ClpS
MSKKQSNKKRGKYQVILLDDDINTFEHVQTCLIDFCDQAPLQAHQCTLLVHHNGKCSVFVDTYEECKIVHEILTKRCNLRAVIIKYKK